MIGTLLVERTVVDTRHVGERPLAGAGRQLSSSTQIVKRALAGTV